VSVRNVFATVCVFTNMQIVSVLRPMLDQCFPEQMGVRIIAEPGRYFAASAFTLAVNIIAKRTVTASDSTSPSPGNYTIYTHTLLTAIFQVILDSQSPGCGAWGRCRINPPHFLAECCKRQLNQGSFVSAVCLIVCFL